MFLLLNITFFLSSKCYFSFPGLLHSLVNIIQNDHQGPLKKVVKHILLLFANKTLCQAWDCCIRLAEDKQFVATSTLAEKCLIRFSKILKNKFNKSFLA